MTSDIRPYGSEAGVGFYWVRDESTFGYYLVLVAITETGEVTRTGVAARYDARALTTREAVIQHLGGGIDRADADLERRRSEAPEPEPEPEPLDPATRRFLEAG